jgi:DNA-binding winged helix-turn-helix (wHTH) protein/tetratricopeptide (TPR) repeat protein
LAECVVLANEPAFAVGGLRVIPALRTVERVDGRREVLEPRVMQVLVALVSAGGAVLSRHDLVERCWAGRIVGDDAINRVMSRLRRVGETIGAGAFRVETVTKVGYRLIVGDSVGGTAHGPGVTQFSAAFSPRAEHPTWPRLQRLPIATALIVFAALAVFAIWPPRLNGAPDDLAILVEPLAAAPADAPAQMLRSGLAADLARVTLDGTTHVRVIEMGDAGKQRGDMRLTGAAETAGGMLRATVRLLGRADDEILWSKSFERSMAEAGPLREEIASQTADVLTCAQQASADRLQVAALRLFLAGCEQMNEDMGEGLATMQRVLEIEPNFLPARSWVAGLQWAVGSSTGGAQGLALREAGVRDAKQILAEHPDAYQAYQILSSNLEGYQNWHERERLLKLAARAPNAGVFSRLAYQDITIGRVEEGLPDLEHSFELSPFSTIAAANLAEVYAYQGRLPAALALLARMEVRYPGSLYVGTTRFEIHARVGDPAAALNEMSKSYIAEYYSPEQIAVWKKFIAARRDPQLVEAARSAIHELAKTASPPVLAELVQHLVQLGDLDGAYRIAPDSTVLDDVWWRSYMAPFRADPRFPAFIEKIGQPQVWRQTGELPDYCTTQKLPYDCRKVFLHRT